MNYITLLSALFAIHRQSSTSSILKVLPLLMLWLHSMEDGRKPILNARCAFHKLVATLNEVTYLRFSPWKGVFRLPYNCTSCQSVQQEKQNECISRTKNATYNTAQTSRRVDLQSSIWLLPVVLTHAIEEHDPLNGRFGVNLEPMRFEWGQS